MDSAGVWGPKQANGGPPGPCGATFRAAPGVFRQFQGEVQYCPDLFDLGSGCSGAHSFGIVRKNRGLIRRASGNL